MVIKIGPSGDVVTIYAYCLTTDSWEDYLGLQQDAREAFERRDMRRANRYLRAGLLLLFSHLEGVVSNICEYIDAPKKIKKRPLWIRIEYVDSKARKHGVIPDSGYLLAKHLRDIVAHPGIDKTLPDGKKLDEVAVYETLNTEFLADIGTKVDEWLTAVCRVLKIDRFTDTKSIVDEFGAHFGTITTTGEV